jgi:hypothetical protein
MSSPFSTGVRRSVVPLRRRSTQQPRQNETGNTYHPDEVGNPAECCFGASLNTPGADTANCFFVVILQFLFDPVPVVRNGTARQLTVPPDIPALTWPTVCCVSPRTRLARPAFPRTELIATARPSFPAVKYHDEAVTPPKWSSRIASNGGPAQKPTHDSDRVVGAGD